MFTETLGGLLTGGNPSVLTIRVAKVSIAEASKAQECPDLKRIAGEDYQLIKKQLEQ